MTLRMSKSASSECSTMRRCTNERFSFICRVCQKAACIYRAHCVCVNSDIEMIELGQIDGNGTQRLHNKNEKKKKYSVLERTHWMTVCEWNMKQVDQKCIWYEGERRFLGACVALTQVHLCCDIYIMQSCYAINWKCLTIRTMYTQQTFGTSVCDVEMLFSLIQYEERELKITREKIDTI